MKDLIKKILKEDVVKTKPYKFTKGGYLVPSTDKFYPEQINTNIMLTDEEYETIKQLNDNCKELYDLHVHKTNLIEEHNKGVIYKFLEKKFNK